MIDATLRDRLDGSTPSTFPPIDLDLVMRQGHRTVFHRRAATVATTTILSALLIASVGIGLRSTSGTATPAATTSRSLPSAPTDSRPTIPTVLGPHAVITTTSSDRLQDTGELVVALGTGFSSGTAHIYDRVADHQIATLDISELAAGQGTFFRDPGGRRIVGVVRGDVTGARLELGPATSNGAWQTQTHPLPRTEYSVVAFVGFDAKDDPAAIGVTWQYGEHDCAATLPEVPQVPGDDHTNAGIRKAVLTDDEGDAFLVWQSQYASGVASKRSHIRVTSGTTTAAAEVLTALSRSPGQPVVIAAVPGPGDPGAFAVTGGSLVGAPSRAKDGQTSFLLQRVRAGSDPLGVRLTGVDRKAWTLPATGMPDQP